MAEPIVGVLHPGEMGASIGAELRRRGTPVVWASEGRSERTRVRAEEAGIEDAGTLDELLRRSSVVLSICPPHAGVDVAQSVGDFEGVFVDANAIAPATVRTVAGIVGERCVDGGIVGPPPGPSTPTHLYLSGGHADDVAALFEGTAVDARVISDEIGHASALKLAYAAWTKGTAALLLAIERFATAEEVDEALVAEWNESIPDLYERLRRSHRSAEAKGWRWVGEMEEIAAAFAADDLPEGFHRAAAEIFRTSPTPWQPGVPS